MKKLFALLFLVGCNPSIPEKAEAPVKAEQPAIVVPVQVPEAEVKEVPKPAGTITLLIPIDGVVARVIDGDTVVLDDEAKTKIRLSSVNCPEKGQPFFDEGKKLAEEMLAGKSIKYVPHGPDKYGRTLGTIFIDGKDFSLLLVRKGLAKCYGKDETYLSEQNAAQEEKIGVWSSEPKRTDPEADKPN